MRTFYILLLAALALSAVLMPTLLFAQAPKLPPFHITAKKMRLNTRQEPKTLIYEGDVVFTSSMSNARITCQLLQTNASSLEKVNSVDASGKVTCVFLIDGKEKGKPASKLEGYAERMRYSVQGKDPVVRLIKEKGVVPRLRLTDLATQDKTDITGDEIEYNLATGDVAVSQVAMGNEERGQ